MVLFYYHYQHSHRFWPAKETEKSASTSIRKYEMMSLKELEINLIYDFLEVF